MKPRSEPVTEARLEAALLQAVPRALKIQAPAGRFVACGVVRNSGRLARFCSGIKCGVNETLGGASSSRVRTPGIQGATAGETAPSFSSANNFSGIGSARGTSAMLHPGVVDGPTASLAGRDSGDSRRDGTLIQHRGEPCRMM